jgi:hypothetical protein
MLSKVCLLVSGSSGKTSGSSSIERETVRTRIRMIIFTLI